MKKFLEFKSQEENKISIPREGKPQGWIGEIKVAKDTKAKGSPCNRRAKMVAPI
jgi:hypothetical protein